MQASHQQFEAHKLKLITGLRTAAESLRNAAIMTDDFASFVHHIPYSTGLNGISPLINFASLLGGDGDASLLLKQLQNASSAQTATSASVDTPVLPTEDNASKKRKIDEATKPVEKEKKEKKVKDPNAPKKPPSAFFLFLSHTRQKYKDENPHIAPKDIQNKLVEIWATMTPQEREPWSKANLLAKKNFDTEKAAYDEQLANSSNEPTTAVAAPAPAAAAAKKTVPPKSAANGTTARKSAKPATESTPATETVARPQSKVAAQLTKSPALKPPVNEDDEESSEDEATEASSEKEVQQETQLRDESSEEEDEEEDSEEDEVDDDEDEEEEKPPAKKIRKNVNESAAVKKAPVAPSSIQATKEKQIGKKEKEKEKKKSKV